MFRHLSAAFAATLILVLSGCGAGVVPHVSGQSTFAPGHISSPRTVRPQDSGGIMTGICPDDSGGIMTGGAQPSDSGGIMTGGSC